MVPLLWIIVDVKLKNMNKETWKGREQEHKESKLKDGLSSNIWKYYVDILKVCVPHKYWIHSLQSYFNSCCLMLLFLWKVTWLSKTDPSIYCPKFLNKLGIRVTGGMWTQGVALMISKHWRRYYLLSTPNLSLAMRNPGRHNCTMEMLKNSNHLKVIFATNHTNPFIRIVSFNFHKSPVGKIVIFSVLQIQELSLEEFK